MTSHRNQGLPADPGAIELSYTHRHGLFDTGDAEPEIWNVTADVWSGEDEPDDHVGNLELVRIDPYRLADALLVLDSYDADLGLIAATVLDEHAGGLNRGLAARLEVHGNDLLIVHEIQLDPKWRGHGLGALLAGLAIRRLSGGCQAAVCYPAPLDWDENGDPDRWDTAVAALSTVWSRLGFQHFRNGVHVLDLALVTLDEAIARLQHRLQQPG